MEPFSREARAAIVSAREEAKALGSNFIRAEHILMGLASRHTEVSQLLEQSGLSLDYLRDIIQKLSPSEYDGKQEMTFDKEAKFVIRQAFVHARESGRSSEGCVGCDTLLKAILDLFESDRKSRRKSVLFTVLDTLSDEVFEHLQAEVDSMLDASKDESYDGSKRYSGKKSDSQALNEKSKVDSEEEDEEGDEDSKGKGREGHGEKAHEESRASRYSGHQSKKAAKTPVLDKYCRDLTKLASEGKLDPLIGREKELENVIMVLNRRTKSNPVLVGDAGVGKTAIVEGLAQRIVNGDVPGPLTGMRVCSLSLSEVVAGTHYRGDLEERFSKILRELTNEHSRVILFIDEIHTLLEAGDSDGGLNAGNMLKPALARGEFKCIGATTADEYDKYISKDRALARRFQTVDVNEPTEEEAVRVLSGLRERYESYHNVDISEAALEAAVHLSKRYITDRFLPDKAVDVLDETCSRASLFKSKKPEELLDKQKELRNLKHLREKALHEGDYALADELRVRYEDSNRILGRLESEWRSREEPGHGAEQKRPQITEEDVARVISLKSGIPVSKVTESEASRLLNLEDVLHKRVISQDEPVELVSKAIKRSRAGFGDPNRPIGSFLFLGPTGVGKTELARTLADFLFDDESSVIKLDMSEYSEKFSASRLYGAAPGYVGYDEGGELTNAVRRRPYSVVLFDEIEKAHPDIFNTLLQIMDEGHLTDAKGHEVNFRNTVVILTSNIGFANPDSSASMGLRTDRNDKLPPDKRFKIMKRKVLEEVKQVFKPEFLNRLDAQVVFRSLENDDLLKIVDIMLGKIRKGLSHNKRDIEVTDMAKRALVASCHELQYGARPLRRAIQRMLEDPLSNEVLSGNFPEESCMIVDLDQEGKERLDPAVQGAGEVLREGVLGASKNSNDDTEDFEMVFTLKEE